MTPTVTILEGDVIAMLRTLPEQSVHCVVTSPPYWGLRDYKVEGQIGLEKTIEEYVAKMVEVFREVRRVLRDDGTCWVNLGDSYNAYNGNRGDSKGLEKNRHEIMPDLESGHGLSAPGLKPKDLCGIPWRVALALQADGWYLRCDIIWHKPNPMPESVTDRPTHAHEYLFLLTKKPHYFYDNEAVKEPAGEQHAKMSKSEIERITQLRAGGANTATGKGRGAKAVTPDGLNKNNNSWSNAVCLRVTSRNLRSVWSIPSEPFKGAHFATYPTSLVRPCILAGTSARGCCPKCLAPWERIVEPGKLIALRGHSTAGPKAATGDSKGRLAAGLSKNHHTPGIRENITLGWQPTCKCRICTICGQDREDHNAQDCDDSGLVACNPVPCTVLDPFLGSGTTAQVALELGRNAIGIELNRDYVALAHARCNVTPGFQMA